MIRLPKIGNLKLGLVRNGKPIATSRILVTKATKEGLENFKILDGFNEDGVETVNISLPFDDINLNFEVSYAGFLTINGIEYIAKAEDIGSDILIYPLEIENEDKTSYNVGTLTEELVEKFAMSRTGLLRCMLENYSGFGEVFYLKTQSINTIEVIRSQLKIISSLTNDRLAGIRLRLRAIQKDIDDKSITYISISPTETLNEDIINRETTKIQYEAFQDMYVSSRERSTTNCTVEELFSNLEVKIERRYEDEVKIIEREADAAVATINSELEQVLANKFPGGCPVKVISLQPLFEALSREDFDTFISKEGLNVRDVVLETARIVRGVEAPKAGVAVEETKAKRTRKRTPKED